jgi:hypothetical protein
MPMEWRQNSQGLYDALGLGQFTLRNPSQKFPSNLNAPFLFAISRSTNVGTTDGELSFKMIDQDGREIGGIGNIKVKYHFADKSWSAIVSGRLNIPIPAPGRFTIILTDSEEMGDHEYRYTFEAV